MTSLRSRLVMAMAAGSLAVVPTVNTRLTQTIGPRGPSDPQAMYQKGSKEFYMTADDLGYIRPGFHITVNSITIPADRRPVVDFSFTDDFDQPLDRLGKVTPGAPQHQPGARLVGRSGPPLHGLHDARPNQPHHQRRGDPGRGRLGRDVDGSGGRSLDLPVQDGPPRAGSTCTKTHTLAIYATRNLTDIIGKNYYDNVEHDFRPDGQTVTETWDKTTNAACNRCHDVLSAHGGSRQDVKLCVTCHQPQTVDPDTGNTVDMKVMVHKIHRGEFLPSVEAGTPYVIIGNQQSVHDFSNVVFPQDIRNCVRVPHSGGLAVERLVHVPVAGRLRRLPRQHQLGDRREPSGRPAGRRLGLRLAATCPQGDREYDASIKGAHTVPYRSTQLKGLNSEIVSVSNAAPGQKPTVVFKITENDGTPVPPASFTTSSGSSNLNILMGGPTTDYAIDPVRERADGATFDGTTGDVSRSPRRFRPTPPAPGPSRSRRGATST